MLAVLSNLANLSVEDRSSLRGYARGKQSADRLISVG
jgi:hypothetical protein